MSGTSISAWWLELSSSWNPRILPLTAAALSVLLLGTPTVAWACSCPNGPAAYVDFPSDAATDVAIDTPIVVTLVDYIGNPADIAIHLEDANGSEVALEQVERVPPSWNGCGAAEIAFVRPSRKLEPGMTYTVSVSLAADPELRQASKFTVGHDSFVPDTPIAAEVTYLKAYLDPACVTAGCDALAEVRVALSQAPDNHLWLFIHSSAQEHGRNHYPFRPEGSRPDFIDGDEDVQTVQLSVVLPKDDGCVDIRIYGREGRALLDEHRCAPDRCASSDVTGGSTCGAPLFSTIDAALVPDASCSGSSVPRFSGGMLVDPAIITSMPKQERSPTPSELRDAGADAGSSPDASQSEEVPARAEPKQPAAHKPVPGCSTLPTRHAPFAPEALGLLIAGWALLRRQQRKQSRGTACGAGCFAP